jgi:hypothetical protein
MNVRCNQPDRRVFSSLPVSYIPTPNPSSAMVSDGASVPLPAPRDLMRTQWQSHGRASQVCRCHIKIAWKAEPRRASIPTASTSAVHHVCPLQQGATEATEANAGALTFFLGTRRGDISA